MACNRKEIVDTILKQCKDVDQFDRPVQLQVIKETLTPTGTAITIVNCLNIFYLLKMINGMDK